MSGPTLVRSNGAPAPPVEFVPWLGLDDDFAGEREIGGVLSPSQVTTFFGCSARWYFRYVLGLEEHQGASRCIGKVLHWTVKENYIQKCETHKDLSLVGALAIYKDQWLKEETLTRFQKDEDPSEMRAMGASLVRQYLEHTAPLIEPDKVETPVSGVIGGVPVRGIIDLIDTRGKIIDLKSAKASPPKNKIRPDYRFQVASYAAIASNVSGEAELHTVVKLKRDVKTVTQAFTINDADRVSVETRYPLAQAMMKSGYAAPNRNSFLCSKRYCSFHVACCTEFGGEVPD